MTSNQNQQESLNFGTNKYKQKHKQEDNKLERKNWSLGLSHRTVIHYFIWKIKMWYILLKYKLNDLSYTSSSSSQGKVFNYAHGISPFLSTSKPKIRWV